MKTNLNTRQVLITLAQSPTISTIEELCAVKNVSIDKVSKEQLEAAKALIARNRLRMQVQLKEELYRKTDMKSHEMLYKMICDETELKRFGIKKTESTLNLNPTIEIKSADPNAVDKIKNL